MKLREAGAAHLHQSVMGGKDGRPQLIGVHALFLLLVGAGFFKTSHSHSPLNVACGQRVAGDAFIPSGLGDLDADAHGKAIRSLRGIAENVLEAELGSLPGRLFVVVVVADLDCHAVLMGVVPHGDKDFLRGGAGVIHFPVKVNDGDGPGKGDGAGDAVPGAVRDLDSHGVLSGERGKLRRRERKGVLMVPLRLFDGPNLPTVQALYDGERVSGVPVVDRVLERGRRGDYAELLIAAAHRRVYVVGDGAGGAGGISTVRGLAVLGPDAIPDRVHRRGDRVAELRRGPVVDFGPCSVVVLPLQLIAYGVAVRVHRRRPGDGETFAAPHVLRHGDGRGRGGGIIPDDGVVPLAVRCIRYQDVRGQIQSRAHTPVAVVREAVVEASRPSTRSGRCTRTTNTGSGATSTRTAKHSSCRWCTRCCSRPGR